MQCVVRGSINIDEFFHLPSIVRPGQTLSSTNLTRRAGGKGANQAVAVARALSLSPPSSSSPPAASNAPSASASVVPPSSTTTPSPSTSDALDKDKTPLARVSLAGAIGPDGTWILPVLCSAGVDAGLVSVLGAGAGDKTTNHDSKTVTDVDPEYAMTGRAIIQLTPGGENSIVLHRGANYHHPLPCDPTHPETKSDNLSKTNADYTHLLLQNEIPWEATLGWLNASGQRHTFFNPSPLPTRAQLASFPWQMLDWLLVNEGEAGDLVELLREERDVPFDETDGKEEKDVVARATKLIHTLHTYTRISKTVNIICTLGAKGVLAFVPRLANAGVDFQSKLVYVPAAPLDPAQVVDTTGAGDCFTGYFVAGLMEAKVERIVSKEDVERVLRRCVYAAGLCVTRHGAMESIPSGGEVDEFMKAHGSAA